MALKIILIVLVTIGIITTIGISQDAYALLHSVLEDESSCHTIFGVNSTWNNAHNKCIMHGNNTISVGTVLKINHGVTLVISDGDELVNEEKIRNRGLLINFGKIINDYGELHNEGHIHNNAGGNITSYNGGAIENHNTVKNKIGGTIKNYGVASGIYNLQHFKNYGTIVNVNNGIINNYHGGTIDNYNGTIYNSLDATIVNWAGGRINNDHGGIIENRSATIDNGNGGIFTNINHSIIHNYEINCIDSAVIHGIMIGNQPVPTTCDIQ